MVEVRRHIEATLHANSSACKAYEYGQSTNELDSALIEINGRYPDRGFVANMGCVAIFHVIKGKGEIHTPNGSNDLEEDAQVFIEKGEAYALEGEMKLLFSASPRWTPEQAQLVV